jgi:3' terminal RNA ribose 2'-O-methyltransferase Hen1
VLLTLTTTERPATDLGFLLHKHPVRAQSFPVAAGTAHVFYPRADADECTAALLLEIDPIGLVRGRQNGGFALAQYVNDRPYVAGSMLAVALGSVFRTAMAGRCDSRPELAARPIPLRIEIPAVPGDLARRLFEPLGWTVATEPIPLDPAFPDWGDSRYVALTLTGTQRLADALKHLYVLLPVLDNGKHYWVGEDEVAKLLRAGEGWLAGHPDRLLVSDRYLAHQRAYVRSALARLAESDDLDTDDLDNALAAPVVASLAERRRAAVLAVLTEAGAHRVLDLGCGNGALLRDLLAQARFTEIVGVDVSAGALAEARKRLDRLGDRQLARITLRQSALTYTDTTLAGYDAAVLMEVIEHVDPSRLPALEHSVFGAAAPATVVVTTPNAEYNVRFPNLPAGRFRHPDHRFEWTRAQFAHWADAVAQRHGYQVRHLPVGDDDPEVGPPTQLAEFTRRAT